MELNFRYSSSAVSIFCLYNGFLSKTSLSSYVASHAFGIVDAMVLKTALWSDHGMGKILEFNISGVIPIGIKMWSILEND